MSQKIVLFDVDKTLIDTEYSLNVPLEVWQNSIKEAQAKGWSLGLNSDSGLAALLQKTAAWGMKGPVISERGALIHHPSGVITDTSGAGWLGLMPQIRDLFAERLRAMGYSVFPTIYDPAMAKEKPGKQIVVVNTLRERSLGFFTRRLVLKEGVVKDTHNLPIIEQILRKFLVDHLGKEVMDELEWDVNPDYAVGIVHHINTRKKRGVEKLMESLRLQKLFMVGDTLHDWIDLPGVVHCGVGNASPEFLRKCTIISPKPLTLGAIDILQQITG